MYGYGVPISGRIVIEDNVLDIDVKDKTAFYKRIYREEVVVSRKIHGMSEIKLFPLYPVNTPSFFTSYILVNFSSPIDLAPAEELSIFAKMPVEIAVYVFKSHRDTNLFKVIDVIPIGGVKYCLYGPLDKGVVARHYVSDTYYSEVEPKLGEAIMKIIVRNKANEWVEFSKILLESNPLTLMYVKGTWKAYTQELNVTINSVRTALVHYGKPFKKNARAILDPPYLKQPVIHFRTEMMWGI